MTAQLIIRKALPADLDILLRFEQGIIEAERPFDETIRAGNIHYYDLAGMLKASHIEVLLAFVDDKPVGCGYARIEDARIYLNHRQHAYLGFMYVVPEYRGKGINQKIMTSLQEWALSKGITELRLDVYIDNEAAVKAYEKAGFTKHVIEMRKPAK